MSLLPYLQNHLSNASRKHTILDYGKYKKRSSKKKYTKGYYHVQNNEDVKHQDFNMYYTTNQFPQIAILWYTQRITRCTCIK